MIRIKRIVVYDAGVGKRKGNHGDSAFIRMSAAEFEALYSIRASLPTDLRMRLEREAKHRGIRNVRKPRKS